MKSSFSFAVAAAAALSVSSIASAAVLFSDSFNSTTDANFTVVKGTAGSTTLLAANDTTQSADFGFNYMAAYGITSPTGSTTDTSGLRLRSNLYGGVQSGVAAFLTGMALPSTYQISFFALSNAVNGGTNSTEAVAYGAGNGALPQVSANGNGYYFAAVRDSTATPYRLYYNGTAQTALAPQTNLYTAKTVTQSGGVDPVTGTTTTANVVGVAAGYSSQVWRQVTITNDGTNLVYTMTSDTATPFTRTVALSSITNLATATNAFLGSYDTSAGSTAADAASAQTSQAAEYDFELFDNFTVSTVPEPTSLSLIGLAGAGLLARRRRA